MVACKVILVLALICSIEFLGLEFQARADMVVCYDDQLKLDLSTFKATQGCDIWLSTNGGNTWVLIGKTFKDEAEYIYKARKSGLHEFHIHCRENEQDSFKPDLKAQKHASMMLGSLEQSNPDILYSNKRALTISYDIQDMTKGMPGGNFQSWLYYTKTSGLDWTLYGVDEDGESPVSFFAQEEGLYGFKVISADIAGQKETIPGPGVVPDVLVRIDTQAPDIEVLYPQAFDLWESGSIREISWNSRDEAMDRLASVALYYSVGEEGHWQLITDQAPSSGIFEWKIPESANGKMFIQAKAADRSGNKGVSARQGPFFTRNILEEMLDPALRTKAEGYYDTATICRKNKDYSKAIKYYRIVFQLNPYHVRAYNDAGISLMHLGLVNEAFENFEMGLKYAPSNENILSNLARLYGEHGQWTEAEQILKRLIVLYPKDPSGLWLMADVRMHQGKADAARDLWERITQLDFSDDSRGPRYRVQSRQKLAETLMMANPQKTSWLFR